VIVEQYELKNVLKRLREVQNVKANRLKAKGKHPNSYLFGKLHCLFEPHYYWW